MIGCSTTMMLIVVIAVFLAVELPLSTMTALHTISSRSGQQQHHWSLVRPHVLCLQRPQRLPGLQPGGQHHPLHQRDHLPLLPPQLRHLLRHVTVSHTRESNIVVALSNIKHLLLVCCTVNHNNDPNFETLRVCPPPTPSTSFLTLLSL